MTDAMPANDVEKGKKGRLFVVSAPSGAGKTTLCKAVRHHLPHLVYSVSTTTRTPREGEKEGIDYFFVTEKAFRQGIEDGKWAEWAWVHDHFYGTSARFIEQHLDEGKDVLLDIDVQGAKQILRRFPDAITIFIMAPSMKALRQRLVQRGLDSPEVIEKRMVNAQKEIAHSHTYRHTIVNDDLTEAIARFVALFADGAH